MKVTNQVDELTKEVWSFYFYNNNLFLDSYHLLKKESTKKKKYEAVKRYNRIDLYRNNNLIEEDVPLSDHVKQEALANFIANIKVMKWSEGN